MNPLTACARFRAPLRGSCGQAGDWEVVHLPCRPGNPCSPQAAGGVRGGFLNPEMTNMHTYVEQFLYWKGGDAPRAAVEYRMWLRHLETFSLGREAEELVAADLVRFRYWLAERYSPQSVKHAMIVVKGFLGYLSLTGVRVLNPGLVRVPKAVSPPRPTVTEAEYGQMLALVSEKEFYSLEKKVVLRLLWETGVRVSELCGLDLADVDVRARSAVIRTKKTQRSRRIFWSAATHDLLLRFLGIRVCLNQQPALFVGLYRDGTPSDRLHVRSVQRLIHYLADEAGIKKKLTPHSFRHGWAHYRRAQGATLQFIQKGLGHENPASTMWYSQFTDPEFEAEAARYLGTHAKV